MPGKTTKSVRPVNRRATLSLKSLKVADAKGRVLLGPKVAKQPVQVEECGAGEWIVRLVEPVPVREAWLFKNPEALRRVQTGFQQAQNREFAADPREGRDYSWLEDVDEENV
jgi:hypothetical protein